ncbi:hypothetical protein AAC387_Pa04g1767 [Persea americana]
MLHLEAKEVPNLFRRISVGVYLCIRRHPKQLTLEIDTIPDEGGPGESGSSRSNEPAELPAVSRADFPPLLRPPPLSTSSALSKNPGPPAAMANLPPVTTASSQAILQGAVSLPLPLTSPPTPRPLAPLLPSPTPVFPNRNYVSPFPQSGVQELITTVAPLLPAPSTISKLPAPSTQPSFIKPTGGSPVPALQTVSPLSGVAWDPAQLLLLQKHLDSLLPSQGLLSTAPQSSNNQPPQKSYASFFPPMPPDMLFDITISKMCLSPTPLSPTNQAVISILKLVTNDSDLKSKMKIFLYIDYNDFSLLAD